MDRVLSLQDAVIHAKNFENFEDILTTVHIHPEWLTCIPENRKWAILHHVVLSGNVQHLDSLLATQESNRKFVLLTKTNDNLTIHDIAKLREEQVQMLNRVQNLIRLDELLSFAEVSNWDKCLQIVKDNPTYGNTKPPHRQYYLIHYIAMKNQTNEFERFESLGNFKFNLMLRVDRRRVNDIARENKAEDFAKYIEGKYPNIFGATNTDNTLYEQSEQAMKRTNDVLDMIEQRNLLDPSSFALGPIKNIHTRGEVDKAVKEKLLKQTMTEAKAVKNNTETKTHLLRLLTCSLTGTILSDPVVAADGFTYERSAIENWLRTHDCSPKTNEKLVHKNLSENRIVKRILTSYIG